MNRTEFTKPTNQTNQTNQAQPRSRQSSNTSVSGQQPAQESQQRGASAQFYAKAAVGELKDVADQVEKDLKGVPHPDGEIAHVSSVTCPHCHADLQGETLTAQGIFNFDELTNKINNAIAQEVTDLLFDIDKKVTDRLCENIRNKLVPCSVQYRYEQLRSLKHKICGNPCKPECEPECKPRPVCEPKPECKPKCKPCKPKCKPACEPKPECRPRKSKCKPCPPPPCDSYSSSSSCSSDSDCDISHTLKRCLISKTEKKRRLCRKIKRDTPSCDLKYFNFKLPVPVPSCPRRKCDPRPRC